MAAQAVQTTREEIGEIGDNQLIGQIEQIQLIGQIEQIQLIFKNAISFVFGFHLIFFRAEKGLKNNFQEGVDR